MATSLSSHQLLASAGLTRRRVSRGASRRRATSVKVRANYGDAQDGDSEEMHVPEDAFKNELGHNISPERKAATALGNLFTMAATRVILDQFTGTRHRSPVYYKMVDFLNENPLRNGNEWLAKLMREPDNDLRITAMRIIETRRVFAESEFNWDVVTRVAKEEIDDDTLEMNKQMLMRSLGVSEDGSPAGDASGTGTRRESEANSSW